MSLHSGSKSVDRSRVVAFDCDYLDLLMDDAGLDFIIATSKHNVQYLLGGHRSNFFHSFDAAGISRFLPVVVYQKGRPQSTIYIGNPTELHEHAVSPIWVPSVEFTSWRTDDALRGAVTHLRRLGMAKHRIGVETAFLPADVDRALRDSFADGTIVDSFAVLERLRARKRPDELEKLREASERITDSMLAAIARHGEGATKNEIVQSLRTEEVSRGLDFEYCLISVGRQINRAPSDVRWRRGEALSIDSGGSYQGYIGDLARMAVVGEPDQELVDLLAEVDAVQEAAIHIVRHGVTGAELYAAAEEVVRRSPNGKHIKFLAHGVGMVTHEVPHLTSDGPVPYEATDVDLPLEEGMVLSIETDLSHPGRGFIKLEDTIAVGAGGYEMFGKAGRSWNLGGSG